MDEPDGEARGQEDHAAAGRLGAEEGAVGGGGMASAGVPDVRGGLGDGGKVCGGQERRLFAEGDEPQVDGGGFPSEFVESVENGCTPSEGSGQIGEAKESSSQEGYMEMAGEKHGSCPVVSAEPSDLLTCLAPNGGAWNNKTLFSRFSVDISSSGNGHVCDMLDKATEGTICENDGLVRNEDDLGGATGVKTGTEDLQMVCTRPQCDNKGLSGLHHDSERWPQVVDGVGFVIYGNNEQMQDDFIPKIKAEVSMSVDDDSIPSFSGRIDDSLGKADRAGETLSNLGTCHMSNGDLCSNVLYAPLSEGCQSKNTGHTTVMANKVTQRSQCGQGDLVCDGGVLSGGEEVKKSLDNLQMFSKEPQCENNGLPHLAEFSIQQLSNSMNELEKDELLANTRVEVCSPIHEDLVPSISGSSINVPFDSKAGQIVKTSEPITTVEKVPCGSQGGGMTSYESKPFKEACADENQCSAVEVKTCEEGLQSRQIETFGDENQHFLMDVPEGSLASACEAKNTDNIRSCDPCAEIEFPFQQSYEKYVISEFPQERDLTSYSQSQPCENEPCYSGRETPVFCLGHQDSADNASTSSHLVQELDTCTSTDDKACYVENGNDSLNQKEAPVVFFRRRNPARAASSRNSYLEKSDQINKANNNTRRSKKVDSVSSLLKSTMVKFPNKTTKGRSVINRPLNSSAWGSLQKLMDGFNQNCGSSTHSHQTCLGKERSNSGSSEKNQLTIRKIRTSRCSKNKNTLFSDIGYVASELIGQSTCLVRTGTDVSSDDIGHIPKSGALALFNTLDCTHRTAQCVEGNHTLKLASILTDTQQLERGMEIVAQEPCPVYSHGECVASTSERSLNNANVGFSPDSVLDIASVTCESNTSASLDVVHENPSCPGGLIGGGLRASASSTSHCGKDHASSLMNLEEQVKTVTENGMRKEDDIPSHAMMENDIGEGKQTLKKSTTARKSRNMRKQECQKNDGKKGKNINRNRGSTKISSGEAPKLVSFSNDSSSPDLSELLLHTKPSKIGSCSKVLISATHDVSMHGYDNMQSHFVTENDDEGSAFDDVKSLRCKKKDSHGGKKGKVRDTHGKGRRKKKNIAGDLSPAAELAFKNSSAASTELPTNVACKNDGTSVSLPPAWVQCDDCKKWRSIPGELEDSIAKDNCRWTCKENKDKKFADCSIPQEKTNAEINAELCLSDASGDEADNDGSSSKAPKEPKFSQIRSNLFQHRNRRTQSIDESMVCNCKPPQDGRMGCRDGCLNRILNIECTKRTCPCGEQCSNQQFQRRNYAKLCRFNTGKKGFGLQLNEDVSEGQFLIEYVGEVLDITAYESRQRYYASKGQKHFYFMALNGGEVIDACTKGNLGRFINHSCSPNCRTEKWMVNGEVCIGIFAMRNIKKGEELTFDYNYVRVSGAAPQKCFCGTAKCRGYIGGDISGADMFAQDDFEAVSSKPMAVEEDAEEVLGANGFSSHGTNLDSFDHEASAKAEDSNECPSANPELESEQQTSGTLFDISEPENSSVALSPQYTEDVARTPIHVSRTVLSMPLQFPEYGIQSSEISQRTPCTLDGPNAPITTNGISLSSDLGSHQPSFHANKKNNVKHHSNVKPLPAPIDNEHILGVEGRLNNLLDGNGGISKRKDATNGYLKLLLVTAAEGDNVGGTSKKSVRDLSLILDALLKTKSRAVLLDIINKNGLQMLHNILKQNRSNFHRIPIIRKLLKVLDFLASKQILTSEHINGGPRYAGTESFRESMLGLIRHNDTQVQQIARIFRDNYIINRNIPRSDRTEYSRASISAHDVHGISMAGGSVPASTCSMDLKSIRRKRKSRWDYQPDDHYKMVGLKIHKVCPVQSELDLQTGLMGNKLHGNWGTNSYLNDVPVVGSSTEGDDEAPPGFEPQQECQPGQKLMEGRVSVAKNGKSHLVCLSIPFHHCHPIQEGVLVLLLRCLRMNTTVQDIVAGLQIETEERIGIGEMGREQNFHIITKDEDFLTIIRDFERAPEVYQNCVRP
uniref:Histone-lysine N-methyltransferase n=1 Tax=Leersia perrieri TaxID=77586 RepID=A0A0D9VH08_9ORYZ